MYGTSLPSSSSLQLFLAFSSCHDLNISQNWEIQVSSGLFWTYSQPCTCVCLPSTPGICWNFWEPVRDIWFTRSSFIIFANLFFLKLILPLQVGGIWTIATHCFWQMPWGIKLFQLKEILGRSNNDRAGNGVFPWRWLSSRESSLIMEIFREI